MEVSGQLHGTAVRSQKRTLVHTEGIHCSEINTYYMFSHEPVNRNSVFKLTVYKSGMINIEENTAYRVGRLVELFIFRMVSSVHLGNTKETESDPRLVELLDEVDRLLSGHVEDRQAAYNLLLEHEDKVCSHYNKSVCIVIKMRVFGHT